MDKGIVPGEIIKSWIKLAGMTQTDVAMRIGVAQGTLATQLNGRRPIPEKRFRQIVEFVNPPQEEISKYLLAVARSKYDLPPSITSGGTAAPQAVPARSNLETARIDRAIAAIGGDTLTGWDNAPAWPDFTARWMLTALDDGVDALYRAILDCPEIALSVRVRLVAAIAERVAE
ncbi:MAG: helix-turn-helix transcriptional regulator [Victivallaceae bacterium]|nr:helix-turn-helix transcriptional regulator [Victivallaceae bacterium]